MMLLFGLFVVFLLQEWAIVTCFYEERGRRFVGEDFRSHSKLYAYHPFTIKTADRYT